MRTRARRGSGAGREVATASGRRERGRKRASGAGSVLELQRLTGNQAVSRLLTGRGAPDTHHLPAAVLAAIQGGAGNAAVGELLRPPPADSHVPGPGTGASVPMTSIPLADGTEEAGVDVPGGRVSVQRDDSGAVGCQPVSMVKVISGALANGLDMGTYYPDLVGAGFWAHGSSAGPFDTGTRAGSNVQLVGTVPSPCSPDGFTLGQTVTYTKRTWNGVRDPLEGRTFDDIAKSGRDATRAPFRQMWLDNGLNISMADPPSIDYSSLTSAEIDRDFVTTLTGPDGSMSVSWSTSIRVAGGRVTSNTVT